MQTSPCLPAQALAAAPGKASGTYTLYISPSCTNRSINERSGVLAYAYVASRRLRLHTASEDIRTPVGVGLPPGMRVA